MLPIVPSFKMPMVRKSIKNEFGKVKGRFSEVILSGHLSWQLSAFTDLAMMPALELLGPQRMPKK